MIDTSIASLGERVSQLTLDDLDRSHLEALKLAIADCMGVTVAGAGEEAVRLAGDVFAEEGGVREAYSLAADRSLTARATAVIDGVAAHVLDFDDVGLDGHPSAVLVPALLAEGQAVSADCGTLLTAYIAAYETWATLRAIIGAPLHGRGWHPSSVFGSVASAAGCAVLHGLDAGQTGYALGLGAAQSSGMVANFGTMAKPFQTARSAEAGIIAARLAKAGMTSNPDILLPGGAFAELYGGGGEPRAPGFFGDGDWAFDRHPITIKAYPVCFAAHRIIDAALELRGDIARMSDIDRIDVKIGAIPAKLLLNHDPRDTLAAKFSAEFAVACGLLHGKVSLAELAPGQIADPRLRELMGKVAVEVTDEIVYQGLFPKYDEMIVHLSNGQAALGTRIEFASGTPEKPLAPSQVASKFTANVSSRLTEEAAQCWFENIMDMKHDTPISEIVSMGRRFDLG